MGLKIVSWNCHYGLDTVKLKELLKNTDFGKDVSLFAFQEILENEYIDIADCDEAAKYKYRHWYGDHQEFGDCHVPRGTEGDLGTALMSCEYKMHRFDQGRIKFRYVIPYIMLKNDSASFILIHVWTKGMPNGYIEPVYKALEHYTPLFEENETYKNLPMILIGDFNFGVKFDNPFFEKFDSELEKYGFKKNDDKIKENDPIQTFRYPRYPDRKYFNDCIYTKKCTVKSFKIGKESEWKDFSDHCPIMAEIEFP